MSEGRPTAPKAANRLSKIIAAFATAHGIPRFPVDVERLALSAHEVFGWKDPIVRVEAADIRGFEGCLQPNDVRSRWLLLYNQSLGSAGRVRFTQAHELGHYILHRVGRSLMACTENDMVSWSKDEADIEGDADQFASYLLMPLDDYRAQVPADPTLDVFTSCANRYGVSLTAAVLKWLDYTSEKALLVYSTDGYINWACSSEPAWKAGAFIKTKGRVVALPAASLAADPRVQRDEEGRTVPAGVWFLHAEAGAELREMKIASDRLGSILTVLRLPGSASMWPPPRLARDD
jgi:hypothetical protein